MEAASQTQAQSTNTARRRARGLGIQAGWLAGAAAVCLLGLAGCSSPRKNPDFKLLSQAWNTIHQEYVDRSALEPTELTYGAIEGMVDALGDTGHSSFLTPEMVDELRRMERGEFKGVGLEIQTKNGQVVIVAPMDGSPAEKAGVRPGDIILKISGQDIADWPLNKVVQKIAGKPGTKIWLTLLEPRTGRTHDVTLVRASIKLHQVSWQKLPGTSIGHVRLATFDAGVTRDLRKALVEMHNAEIKSIILDLRNNSGGLLDEAIGVASQFLETGNVLLGKDAKGKVKPVPVEKGGLATTIPLVVLVNEGSASAAEIVAGALQDSHRAMLIGQTTFGTGTVLEEFRLSDGSALLLAVQEWLTPAGHSFWHKGILPDVILPLMADIQPLFPAGERGMTPQELEHSDDHQLLKAMEIVAQERIPGNLKALEQTSGSGRRQERQERANEENGANGINGDAAGDEPRTEGPSR